MLEANNEANLTNLFIYSPIPIRISSSHLSKILALEGPFFFSAHRLHSLRLKDCLYLLLWFLPYNFLDHSVSPNFLGWTTIQKWNRLKVVPLAQRRPLLLCLPVLRPFGASRQRPLTPFVAVLSDCSLQPSAVMVGILTQRQPRSTQQIHHSCEDLKAGIFR